MAATLLTRVAMLGSLWWVLTDGDGRAFLFGGPVIVVVAGWQFRETRTGGRTLRLWRVVVFAPFYLWRSLTGGCDVAWRALHWHLPIEPNVLRYRFHLPADSPARVFFANAVSLLPGTLSASWQGDELQIHILADGERSFSRLRELEDRVASLFGHEPLSPEGGAGR